MIAVYDIASGALRYIGPQGSQREGDGVVSLPNGYNDETFTWSTATRTMSESPAKVETQLIASVKSKAETLRMAELTRGFGKTESYKRKQRDGDASASVLAAVLNGLTAAQARLQYPAAATEARRTGEPLATVLTRYRTRTAAVGAELDRIEAIEWAGCQAIKAATTASGKRTAAAIDWSWA